MNNEKVETIISQIFFIATFCKRVVSGLISNSYVNFKFVWWGSNLQIIQEHLKLQKMVKSVISFSNVNPPTLKLIYENKNKMMMDDEYSKS